MEPNILFIKCLLQIIFYRRKQIIVQQKEEIETQTEELLERNENLNELNRSLEQVEAELNKKNGLLSEQNLELEHFAYIVSHDLKAPLRGIDRLANFIEQDFKSDKQQSAYSYLDVLKSRVKRMEGFIKGILDFSKIGMVQSENESIELNELVNEAFDLLEVEKSELKITQPLPTIFSVKILFVQLFSNLISNAVKYNDKDQGLIEIGYQVSKNGYEFSVKDNGPGIAQEHHEKIFDAFQTLNTRDTFESTGIGLSIIKKIVSKLGGNIRIESEPNKGANFIVWLPVKPNAL